MIFSSIHKKRVQVSTIRKSSKVTDPTPSTGIPQLRGTIQKGDPKHSKPHKMKRQRNIQQVKEHGKNPPDQTKKEEIGSLYEKEFRIMIVKMI